MKGRTRITILLLRRLAETIRKYFRHDFGYTSNGPSYQCQCAMNMQYKMWNTNFIYLLPYSLVMKRRKIESIKLLNFIKVKIHRGNRNSRDNKSYQLACWLVGQSSSTTYNMKTFLSLLLLAVVVTTEKIRFDDHEVYSLDVKTIDQLQALRNIENNDGFTFWNTIALNRQVDLMVSPEKQSEFLQIVQELNLNHVLKIENVQT